MKGEIWAVSCPRTEYQRETEGAIITGDWPSKNAMRVHKSFTDIETALSRGSQHMKLEKKKIKDLRDYLSRVIYVNIRRILPKQRLPLSNEGPIKTGGAAHREQPRPANIHKQLKPFFFFWRVITVTQGCLELLTYWKATIQKVKYTLYRRRILSCGDFSQPTVEGFTRSLFRLWYSCESSHTWCQTAISPIRKAWHIFLSRPLAGE